MIAYSNLDLKPWEFWNNINPRSFLKMCEGFNLKYKREQRDRIEEMKVMRWVGSLIYNVNVAKNNRKDPHKLYPLPELKEDNEKELKIPTKAEMDEIAEWSYPRKLNDDSIFEAIAKHKKLENANR